MIKIDQEIDFEQMKKNAKGYELRFTGLSFISFGIGFFRRVQREIQHRNGADSDHSDGVEAAGEFRQSRWRIANDHSLPPSS